MTIAVCTVEGSSRDRSERAPRRSGRGPAGPRRRVLSRRRRQRAHSRGKLGLASAREAACLRCGPERLAERPCLPSRTGHRHQDQFPRKPDGRRANSLPRCGASNTKTAAPQVSCRARSLPNEPGYKRTCALGANGGNRTRTTLPSRDFKSYHTYYILLKQLDNSVFKKCMCKRLCKNSPFFALLSEPFAHLGF